MQIRVGLELDNEDRALAWALDHAGCFAYGVDGPAAVITLAREMVHYDQWIRRHLGSSWLESGDFDFRIVETWQVYTVNDQYELEEGAYAVNAWFQNDWKPLTEEEIERGLTMLEWSREDLLQIVSGLSAEQLDRQFEKERWSIRGILKHVANAEWWYLDRLNLVSNGREDMPKEPLERLDWVRQKLTAGLPLLSGKELVLGKESEFWSPRKLLRRALWHEMDHSQHIQKLLAR
ncbi:MAG: DinB family protein [Anaerolineaceae bacterium]|nr:DinB family protein [Anaerolineaceae bacterium]